MIRSISYLGPALVLLLIWSPEITHYYIANATIPNQTIELARQFPADKVLNEIKGFYFATELDQSLNSDKQLISTAEKILQGNIDFPGYRHMSIGMPFNVDDIDKGSETWQLQLSSFVIPRILLRAYQVSGRDVFLITARDVIRSWASYERSAFLPKGYLWNDHAIAARISVLAEFWRLYRKHSAYQEKVARDILQFVARNGQMLAKNEHFTYATNHGIMQNLALWHICLAFPNLPHVQLYRKLAFQRMCEQLSFYVNEEGIVLEHSAGYHQSGLQWLGMSFRYLTLLNMPIPEEWKRKYTRAKDFYAMLRRPDGTLPVFGDTSSEEDVLGPLVTDVEGASQCELLGYKTDWIPRRANALYPVSGYSIWWDGLDDWPRKQKLNQTVVAWSYFPGHGHKHADEMNVLLYAGGQTWWTNVGYWQLGTKGREEAVSWSGSNAPHLRNESIKSKRNTGLQWYGSSTRISFLDLERRGPEGFIARRQIVHLKPSLWIILDSFPGVEKSLATTVWTTSHCINVKEGKFPDSYVLDTPNSRSTLTKFIFGSEDVETKHFKGSFMPFAGWEVIGSQTVPASAIVVEQPANNSWAATVWSMQDDFNTSVQFTDRPYIQHWDNAEAWKMALPIKSGRMIISRQRDRICVDHHASNSRPQELVLTKGPVIADELAKIRIAYEKTKNKYPKFRDVFEYRQKVTYFLILIFIVQELFFFAYRRTAWKNYTILRALNLLGWVGGGIWLFTVYFGT